MALDAIGTLGPIERGLLRKWGDTGMTTLDEVAEHIEAALKLKTIGER